VNLEHIPRKTKTERNKERKKKERARLEQAKRDRKALMASVATLDEKAKEVYYFFTHALILSLMRKRREARKKGRRDKN
jgi:hypothetical protein